MVTHSVWFQCMQTKGSEMRKKGFAQEGDRGQMSACFRRNLLRFSLFWRMYV